MPNTLYYHRYFPFASGSTATYYSHMLLFCAFRSLNFNVVCILSNVIYVWSFHGILHTSKYYLIGFIKLSCGCTYFNLSFHTNSTYSVQCSSLNYKLSCNFNLFTNCSSLMVLQIFVPSLDLECAIFQYLYLFKDMFFMQQNH